MPIFGVGKVYRIWTPKGGPPQYNRTNTDSTPSSPRTPVNLHGGSAQPQNHTGILPAAPGTLQNIEVIEFQPPLWPSMSGSLLRIVRRVCARCEQQHHCARPLRCLTETHGGGGGCGRRWKMSYSPQRFISHAQPVWFLVDSFENIVSYLEEGVARRLGKGHAWMSTNFGVGCCCWSTDLLIFLKRLNVRTQRSDLRILHVDSFSGCLSSCCWHKESKLTKTTWDSKRSFFLSIAAFARLDQQAIACSKFPINWCSYKFFILVKKWTKDGVLLENQHTVQWGHHESSNARSQNEKDSSKLSTDKQQQMWWLTRLNSAVLTSTVWGFLYVESCWYRLCLVELD